MSERNVKQWPMPGDVVEMSGISTSMEWWSVATVTYRSAVDGSVSLTRPSALPDAPPVQAQLTLEDYRQRVYRVMERW